jgi:hypothetical protein
MPKKPDRKALCRELLAIEKKHAKDFGRMDEIKSILKEDAAGENFDVTIAGMGKVNVSAPKPKRMDGTRQELCLETFLALPQARQEKLEEQGIVATVEIWKDAYGGRVTTKLF